MFVRAGCLCLLALSAPELAAAFVPRGKIGGITSLPGSSGKVVGAALPARVHVQARGGYYGSTRRGRSLQMEDWRPEAPMVGGGFNSAGEAPFEIRGFSLANAASIIGVAVTAVSFAEYFGSGGAGGLSGIGFIYGIPISLIGLALKYAELAPAPLQTTPEAEALFSEKATETLRKIKQDVTRHRYGDEAHLDSTIKFLGLVMPQSDYPQLEYLTQTVEPNGELGFMMVFQSQATPFKRWAEPERVQKYVSFFGPGIDAEVIKVSSEKRLVGIKLTTLPPGASPTPKVAPVPPAQTEASSAAEPAASPSADSQV